MNLATMSAFYNSCVTPERRPKRIRVHKDDYGDMISHCSMLYRTSPFTLEPLIFRGAILEPADVIFPEVIEWIETPLPSTPQDPLPTQAIDLRSGYLGQLIREKERMASVEPIGDGRYLINVEVDRPSTVTLLIGLHGEPLSLSVAARPEPLGDASGSGARLGPM